MKMMGISEEVKSSYEGKVNNIITVEELCQKTDLTIENLLLKGDITFLKFIYNNKTLLVADRNLKNMISWDRLDERDLVFGKVIEIDNISYKVKLLTASEWDKLIVKHIPLDRDSHWRYMWSWCQNVYLRYYSSDLTIRVLRGDSTVSGFDDAPSSTVFATAGWRPVLELL